MATTFARLFDGDGGVATLIFFLATSTRGAVRLGNSALAKTMLDRDRYILVDRAGVSLLFVNSEFGQQIQYYVRLDFELPGQLVDSDLQLHR